MMPNPPAQRFRSRDGLELAYRELGVGRPLVLIHGYFSTATVNWLRYGHAAKIAARGYRVIMPDLRAHGDSARPHDAAFYPPDILADDGFALTSAPRRTFMFSKSCSVGKEALPMGA